MNRVCVIVALICSCGSLPSKAAENPIPDLSGHWGRNSLDFEAPASGPGPVFNLARQSNGAPDINTLVGDYDNPILKPNAVEQLKRMGEISRRGGLFPDPHNSCWPSPVPYILYSFEIQILQEPDQVTILYMEDHEVRRIKLNAQHNTGAAPSWYGESVGRYEGDALVVDTVGVKVGPLAYIDQYGTPFSDRLHVVERYRLVDNDMVSRSIEQHEKDHGRIGPGGGGATIDPNYKGNALQITFNVEDAGVFTMPWSAASTYRKASNAWEERVCAETTHDHATGHDTDIPTSAKQDF